MRAAEQDRPDVKERRDRWFADLGGVRVGLAPAADFDGVQIVLQPGTAPRIDGHAVYPPQLRGLGVGVLQLSPVDGRPVLASAAATTASRRPAAECSSPRRPAWPMC